MHNLSQNNSHLFTNLNQPINELLEKATTFSNTDSAVSIRYLKDLSKALNKDYWEVIEDFKFYIGNKENNNWVYVPKHFITDGGTIPKFLHWLIGPWGDHSKAVVVHDVLCVTLSTYQNGIKNTITRTQADKIFLECLLVTGVSKIKSYAMYYAVRAYSLIKNNK
jgi:hypothetical protein